MKRVSFKDTHVQTLKPRQVPPPFRGFDIRAYLAAGLTVVLWASAFPEFELLC